MKTTPKNLPPSSSLRPILGYKIFTDDRTTFIDTLLRVAGNTRAPFRIDYLNAAQFNRGEMDSEFGQRLRGMDLLYADGQSIVWAGKRCGVHIAERLTAADFVGEFFRRAASSGVSIALVGGTPGAAASFASYWRSQVPALEIRYERDGYFSPDEETDALEAIDQSNADIVLVGMGAPRQEAFVDRAAQSGAPRLWWCVGALFEYGAWGKRRAPQWMCRAGLEWAFRLAQEPRRLAGRYLIGNPLFIWRVLLKR